jgi:hypothetical protein
MNFGQIVANSDIDPCLAHVNCCKIAATLNVRNALYTG